MQQINFYRQRVAINVLAKDIANAVKRCMAEVPSISVGLGAGDPAQYYKAAMIAAHTPGSGFAAGALAATGGEQTHINALVSPTGTPGEVVISTCGAARRYLTG